MSFFDSGYRVVRVRQKAAGSQTWTASTVVSDPSHAIDSAGDLAVGSDGHAAVVWTEPYPGHTDLWLALFDPGSGAWQAPQHLPVTIPGGITNAGVALTAGNAVVLSTDYEADADVYARTVGVQ